MYFPPTFYSTIVVDIPLGRYRVIEYFATFDETIGLFKVYMQTICSSKLYMTLFNDHDLL
jgi:hypothetical protein